MDYSSVSSVTAREFVPAKPAGNNPPAATKSVSANDEPFSFWDVLDLVNPLQHIPVVNTIYREATGDTIKTPMKIIGSTIIGGPIGFASAVADGLVEEATGKDIGAHAMSVFGPDPTGEGSAETQIADAREFIPAAVAGATMTADAREFIPDAATGDTMLADGREFVPSPLAGEVNETAVAEARAIVPRAVAAPVLIAAAEIATEQDALAAGNDLLRMAAFRDLNATRVAAIQPPRQATAKLAAAQMAANADPRKALARAPSTASAQPLPPQQLAAQQVTQQQPSDAEAMITAAQIAAKAHVRVPSVAAAQPKSPQQVAVAGDRFLPLSATAQPREMAAPRATGAKANTAELQSLMARTKYSPGVRGNRDISPAILAQATKPRAVANPAVAANQYDLARQMAAGSGSAPQDVPGWFDDAMMSAIDKYNAMKSTAPGL